MSFLDNASDMIDRGVTAARGAVATVAGEQLGFVRSFCRMCQAGYDAGYHEHNGGNASYVLTHEDVRQVSTYFYDSPGSWVSLGEKAVPEMAQTHLLVTGTGKHLRNVADFPVENIGIVEVDNCGSAFRVVWGFKDGGLPTSELGAHLASHAVRLRTTRSAARVLYHAHPTALVALTTLVPPDSRTLTRVLWSSFTEAVIAVPEGVGAIGIEVPGSASLARATADALVDHRACVWQLHGAFSSGATCDEALGIISALEKAADVYLRACAAQGGNRNLAFSLSDADIRATATAYNLPINEQYLS